MSKVDLDRFIDFMVEYKKEITKDYEEEIERLNKINKNLEEELSRVYEIELDYPKQFVEEEIKKVELVVDKE